MTTTEAKTMTTSQNSVSVRRTPSVYATSTDVLLTTFGEVARDLLGDRARPLNDQDTEAAEELLDSVELPAVVRWLPQYFGCADEAIQQQHHSFIWFCGFVLVMEGMADL